MRTAPIKLRITLIFVRVHGSYVIVLMYHTSRSYMECNLTRTGAFRLAIMKFHLALHRYNFFLFVSISPIHFKIKLIDNHESVAQITESKSFPKYKFLRGQRGARKFLTNQEPLKRDPATLYLVLRVHLC